MRTSSSSGPAAQEAWQARDYDDTKFMVPDSRNAVPAQRLLDTLGQKTWTIEYWLKLDGPPEGEAIVLDLGMGLVSSLQCVLAPGRKVFALRGSTVDQGFTCPTDASRLSDGQWHHVAFTREGPQAKHYLDGRLQTAPTPGSASLSASANQPGLIGVVYANPQEFKDPLNVRVCGAVDFYWGQTNDIAFAERWRGAICTASADANDTYKGAYSKRAVDQDEVFEFFAECKDGVRLTIGDETVVDGLNNPDARLGKCRISPTKRHPITLEFAVRPHSQTMRGRLMWRRPGKNWEVIPSTAFSHSKDDQAVVLNEAKETLNERFYFDLGAGRLYQDPLDGQLDELRVSNVIRYSDSFPVPGSFSRNYGSNPPMPAAATGPPLLFDGEAHTGPIRLESRKHVFIDDVLVEARQGIHLVSHPPTLRPEDVKGVAKVPDSVYELDGREIHYICDGGPPSRPGSTNWDGRMFEDANPEARPDERYKYAGRDVQRGIYLFASPDGIHWRRNETIMLPFDPDGGNEIFWDGQRGMYVSFMRNMGWIFGRAPFGRAASMGQTREIFKPWPFTSRPNPELATKAFTLPAFSTELPVVLEPYPQQGHGGFVTQGHIYRTRALKYPWADDTYYAFIWRLSYPPEGGDEIRVTELATSRDGQNWRSCGEPYFYDVDWMLEPDFQVIEALSAEGLVRRGDELWTYCWLREDSHHSSKTGKSRIVRYVNRLDGLTSLEARQKPGWLRTRPIIFAGDRLQLNLAAQGSVRVGLLDEAGNEIPEFTLQDCELIKENDVRHTVKWRNNPDVSRLAGRPIRLQFEMQDAQLTPFNSRIHLLPKECRQVPLARRFSNSWY